VFLAKECSKYIIIINVEILETPSWCTANLAQGTLATTIKVDEISHVSTQISLQVADDAPAFGLGYIKLRASAQKAGLVQGYTQEFTLNFVPDYKPLIQAAFPETNTKDIGPLDTAVFSIQVTNLGNARTKVLLTVTNLPTGWNAIITDELILEEGAGSMNTAYLTIRPPKDFG
jgi:hypothetical protein